MYVCIYIYIYIRIYVSYIYICPYTCTYEYFYGCVFTYVCLCVCVRACVCVCVCVRTIRISLFCLLGNEFELTYSFLLRLCCFYFSDISKFICHINDSKIWQKEKLIGYGHYTEVNLYKFKLNNIGVAVKQVKYHPHDCTVECEIKSFENDIKNFVKLSHHCLVKHYGSIIKEDECVLSVFIEYMEMGSLASFIKKNGPLNIEKTRQLTRCVLEGLSYLHSKNILHRDIKCQNIFLENENRVKLADFSMAKQLQTVSLTHGTKTIGLGKYYWMAPEIINGEEYNLKADIWSVGCTIVEMLTGFPPWYPSEQVGVVRQITKKTFPVYKLSDTCNEVESFLQQCFVYSVESRCSVDQLLLTEFGSKLVTKILI